MTTADPSEALVKVIEGARHLPNTHEFLRCWELYGEVAYIEHVENMFFHFDVEAGYYNLAILGDGRIADIESDGSDGSRNLWVYSLASIHEVILRAGPLTARARTKGALLVMTARQAGRDHDESPYWFAKTRDEERQLMDFAQSVIEVVSDPSRRDVSR